MVGLLIMAKRDNNYSRTKNRKDYQAPINVEDTLDFLEQHGKLPPKKVLPPRFVNERCMLYYNEIIKINKELESCEENKKELLKYDKTQLQTKIINLVSIVIGSVIKRFKTLYPAYYNDVFTECVIDILLKINKDHYDSDRSSFHSYCYETSYQSCIKFLNNKATYENSAISLIQS